MDMILGTRRDKSSVDDNSRWATTYAFHRRQIRFAKQKCRFLLSFIVEWAQINGCAEIVFRRITKTMQFNFNCIVKNSTSLYLPVIHRRKLFEIIKPVFSIIFSGIGSHQINLRNYKRCTKNFALDITGPVRSQIVVLTDSQ